MKKKMIIGVSIVLLLGLLGFLLYWYIPLRIDVDIDKIEFVGTDVLVRDSADGTHKALYKPDGNGGISDEAFKILAFTDTHFDTYKKNGNFTAKYLIENVKTEKPDLVVFVGDLVTSTNNKVRVKQVGEMMEKLGVYWVAVLGNHEGDKARSIPRKQFVEIFSSYPHCLISNATEKTSDGEAIFGYGNTQIDILGKGGVTKQSLFFIDSGNRVSEEDVKTYNIEADGYDYVKKSQIKWYSERVAALGEGVKSMVFLHIPLCEYVDAYADAPKNADGSLDYSKASENGTQAFFGEALESSGCSKVNSGFFDAILAGGSTQAVVCGHDHVNNFRIQYKGVMLCYNRASGYSSYNAVSSNRGDLLGQGASVYSIHEDGAITYGDILNRERYDVSEAYELYK